MTAPRQVLPGTTYLITRRCAQRQFLLTPSEQTNDIFRYVLAVAASRHGIEVHGVCVMSNHFHLVATDPRGVLPAFLQVLNGFVARAINTTLDRTESFWAPASYSAVTLPTPVDVFDKLVYTLANPVRAGIVPNGSQWAGVRSTPADIGGGTIEADRPAVFFRATGGLPEHASIELTPPPGITDTRDFQRRLNDALEEREEAIRQEYDRDGRSFIGPEAVERQRPEDRPSTEAPRRVLNPRVAARDLKLRVKLLANLRSFLRAYREAWAAFKTGSKEILFPPGTYWMRVAHGVPCQAA